MASPAKADESSCTNSLLTAQPEGDKSITVGDKDEGYDHDSGVAPETPSDEEDKERDRTSPRPLDVPSSSDAASSIPELKDRLQKLKEEVGEKLTSDQEREFQECIDGMGESEAQNKTDSTTKSSSSVVDWLRNSSDSVSNDSDELPYGTKDDEDRTHRPDPKTRLPPITLSKYDVETAQAWSKKSMEKIVAEIYFTNIYSFPDRFQLFVAGVSFQMVVEAICKVRYVDEPETADHEAAIHVESFLEALEEKTSEIPDAAVLAKIRNSIAHGNVYLEGNNMRMYNRHRTQMKCTEIHTCTVDEFIKLSAKMCALFLSWPKIFEYLPKESMVKTAEEESEK